MCVVLFLNVETLEIIAHFGLIPLTMGALAVPIGARNRHPANITIADDAVRSGRKSWQLDKVADFNVWRGSRINAKEPPPVVQSTSDGGLIHGRKSTSAMASCARYGRMVDRSHLVSLRTRAGSVETISSGGLTLDRAEALQRDLREVRSAHSKASIGGVG